MATILQRIPSPGLQCTSLIFDIQYHVTIWRAQVYSSLRSCFFLSSPLTKYWFSIGLQAHVRLICYNQGRIFWRAVNANPGLKVNRVIPFSSIQMFFAALFCVQGDYRNFKQKAKQYREILSSKLQNSNQNSTFSCGSLIGS